MKRISKDKSKKRKDYIQYVVITITNSKGIVTAFNFGKVINEYAKDVETFYGLSGISKTVYEVEEFEEYANHIDNLLFESNAELITVY